MWSVDLEFRFLTLNQEVVRNLQGIHGRLPVLGMRPEDLLPAAEAASWNRIYKETLAKGSLEVESPLPDGRILAFKLRCMMADGKRSGISVIGHDITAAKSADEARRFLAAAVESSEDGIISYGRDACILTWNHGAETLFGYTAEEAVGNPFTMLVVPERRDDFLAYTQNLLMGYTSHQRRGIGLRKGGARFQVAVTSWPVRDDTGAITAIALSVRDVTKQHEAEEARALLAAIVESSEDAVYAVRLDGSIVSWNRGAEILFGYSKHEMLGQNISTIVPPDRSQEVRRNIERVVSGQTVSQQETVRRGKDGREIDVSISVSAICNSEDQVIGVSAICRDISVRKATERDLRETEEFLQDAQVIGGLGYYVLDIGSGRWTSSDVLDEIFGIGKNYERTVEGWTHLIHPDDRALMAAYFAEEVLGAGKKFDKEYRAVRQCDGSVRWLHGLGKLAMNSEGRPVKMRGVIRDITERKTAELQLRESEQRYRTAFEMTLDAVNIVRAEDGKQIDCNQAFLDIFGYTREEVIGRTSREMGLWEDFQDREQLREQVQRHSVCRNMEARFRKKSGEVFWGLVSTSGITLDGVPCRLSVTRDISEDKKTEAEIRDLAFHDPLTGLPNRRLLVERLEDALVADHRKGRSRALLFLDLDNFKTLNDKFGHPGGDRLLQEVARRLLDGTRENDLVARQGGDEFVVMLSELSDTEDVARAKAKVVGEKILAAIARPFQIDGRDCVCTASIGITVFMDHLSTASEILRQADIAMYEAKDSGRNTMRFFPTQTKD
jgi:diguanylate cyclase (GGDEF)-like protein/PAS domain S-box-containing protein